MQSHFYLPLCSLGLIRQKNKYSIGLFSSSHVFPSLSHVCNQKRKQATTAKTTKWFRLLQSCCQISVNIELHFNMISAIFCIILSINLHNQTVFTDGDVLGAYKPETKRTLSLRVFRLLDMRRKICMKKSETRLLEKFRSD